MGNTSPNGPGIASIKREESFDSSPKGRNSGSFGSSDRITFRHRRSSPLTRGNRSQSLEQTGVHSPSSSRSSSSNSYLNSIMNGEKACLRQKSSPKFKIQGDLNQNQFLHVKRKWKQVMKMNKDDEHEIASKLLLRIFQIDPRNQNYFSLNTVPYAELRHNPIFLQHVKAFSPTLMQVMVHPMNATTCSKYLQQLGGRHVQYTGVTYRSAYWKTFVQALVDIAVADTAESIDAFTVLGAFCVEQMRIGYKIEYKLQREAERLYVTSKVQPTRKTQ
ncbi:globin domain-containing protein [Ditylenchus destructor]|nr:globin domain-containing protein [Ditylenchus destructor]